jgi:acyl carrier protein
MNEQEIKTVVRSIIRRWSAAGPVVMTAEHDLHGDLGLKVLDSLQVVMDVEDTWPGLVYITDEEAENIRTVGDLESLVLAKIAHPEAQPA